MRSAGKARGLLYAALACYLTLQPVPAHALLVSAGETVRIDFDLTGQSPGPNYGSLTINLVFDTGDQFGGVDQFTFNIFDTEGGSSIGGDTVGATSIPQSAVVASASLLPQTADGIGFYLLGVDVGSFDLTSATVQGTNFEASPDTTSAVNAPISLVSAVPLPAALPLFLSALAGLGLFGWRGRVKAAA